MSTEPEETLAKSLRVHVTQEAYKKNKKLGQWFQKLYDLADTDIDPDGEKRIELQHVEKLMIAYHMKAHGLVTEDKNPRFRVYRKNGREFAVFELD